MAITMGGLIAAGDVATSLQATDSVPIWRPGAASGHRNLMLEASSFALGFNETLEGAKIATPWDAETTYSTPGVIVSRYGYHATVTGEATNLNKDPILPENGNYWVVSPGIRALMVQYRSRAPILTGFQSWSNYNDANYRNTLLVDTATFGDVDYNFYYVALDGATVTGDATLEAIFRVGEPDEYPWYSLVAPGGTLIDTRGRLQRAIDATGGMADSLAEILDDAMQQITGDTLLSSTIGIREEVIQTGVFGSSGTTTNRVAFDASGGTALTFDSANSTSPNPAKTDPAYTRDKSITVGGMYIVVMVAA